MKTEDWILALTAGLVIYLLNEKQKDTHTIINLNYQNNQLVQLNKEQNYRINQLNDELRKTIEKKEILPDEIKADLTKLISDFDKFDKDIAEELISISSLIEIDEKPKALFSISKIIENLLKKALGSNEGFNNLIEKAKTDNILTSEEGHFLHGIRVIRNKEGHELNVTVEKHLTASSFMMG